MYFKKNLELLEYIFIILFFAIIHINVFSIKIIQKATIVVFVSTLGTPPPP